MKYTNGPGLKYLNTKQVWWGGCYCGICGSRNESELIPRAVRYWDADDGWKMGILCQECTDEARDRGPRKGGYAYPLPPEEVSKGERIDILAEYGDLDGAYSDQME